MSFCLCRHSERHQEVNDLHMCFLSTIDDNMVTSGYVSEDDMVTALSATCRSVDSLSTDLAISDEDGSGSAYESSFWESSDRNDCDSVDSDAVTQFSGSLSD